MKVVIYLQSPLRRWTLGEELVSRLREDFADCEFLVASSAGKVGELLSDAEVYWGWPFKGEWVAAAPRLRWVATPAAGLDWIACPELYESDIVVTRSCFHGRIMAESALAMLLYFERRLGACLSAQREGGWAREVLDREAGVLAGKTLCVVGTGRIGAHVARLARCFGMNIIGVRREVGRACLPFDEILSAQDLPRALSVADHVVVALPSTESTHHLIGAREFAAMKPGAYFHNIGRGSCVDEAAIVAALREGQIAGAGLDVFAEEPLSADSPLRGMSNVLITPHGSAIASSYMTLATEEFEDNLRRFQAGEPLENVVERSSDLWRPESGSHSPGE